MQTHVFHDFDAFADAVRDVDSKMMLRNARRRIWSISSVDLGQVDVQHGRLGSGNIASAELRSDGYMLYLPLTSGCAYSANGIVMDEGSFAVFEPGSEICVSTKDEHDWCTAFVPTHILAKEDKLEDSSSLGGTRTVRVTRADRALANRFREQVGQIMTATANCSPFESSPAATFAAAELMKVVGSVIGQTPADNTNQIGRPKLSRQEIIRRAVKLLERRDGERIIVADLADAVDVSERTLRTVFHEYFGVGPVRYLQLRQLNHVHRALRAADPENTTVSQVLVEHGEWEFSRFASRYRRLFGELPSETLRARKR